MGESSRTVKTMGKIAAHEFITLDGVYSDPSWTAPYGFPDAMADAIGTLTESSSGILLGRTTFEMFAPAWSTRTADDDPGAPFFNDTPKHVVSGTLSSAESWQNSQLLGRYDADVIRELKSAGDLYVSGSGTLVRGLLADGLLDELHLFIFPLVLGAGARLFPDGVRRAELQLRGQQTFENGVMHVTYGPDTSARTTS
jgi:dihydrofolate reductase